MPYLTSLATQRRQSAESEKHMNPPTVVAEAGCNHRGDMDIAQEMIVTAAIYCKVDVVKFQKRCPRELLSAKEYAAPHPNPMHSYGESYGQHREFLEFTLEQHAQLKAWCEELGLVYSTSVWDMTSARQIVELGPEFLKIPSACNLDFAMLRFLCTHYEGDIHVSLGMTTRAEEESIVAFFEAQGRSSSLVLYSCTSGYPVPFEDICLLEIGRLRNYYEARVKAIGFSGHHLGIAADVAAMTLGATWVERHYTLDRTWKGTDHAASLEPQGLRKLCRDLRHVSQAIAAKPCEMLPVEEAQRGKLKRPLTSPG
jgi:sialic acid synthase